ncbi:hypothetical protein COCC4DRAFT_136912 [Bipolaris maydis ATCC 48331]|uniref:Uncharacterized protein n=2 Tax=Cochliobolus heterostrophus TaxID=5016 RepID=M2SUB5_COCH5|nr:uncharacterized protein COCC4DRAFT_136912 [Bipolaris maydis ATCC 48331]EMD88930.1 hypothetical protein COCHEDRAFT_1109611 [Bipolaris maydis C5]ENI05354.1 hypothetical protein COCC4DRAFT_136912 [Bipolaris maydis ATCC 48331]
MIKWLEPQTLRSLVVSLLTLLGRPCRRLSSIHVYKASACLPGVVFALPASGQRPGQLRQHIEFDETHRHDYIAVNPWTYSEHLDWIVQARNRAVESAMATAVPVEKPSWRLSADLLPRP